MNYFDFDKKIISASEKAEEMANEAFQKTNYITELNQRKMLKAFQNARVSESHFTASTGYGYGDRGREALDEVFAFALNAEDALVRYNFVSGTHTITTALFGVLRPNDTMLSVTGIPYDTLQGVIGIASDGKTISGNTGTLIDFGINYEQLDLLSDGTVDYEGMKQRITLAPNCIVMLDNCYGEFVQEYEPTIGNVDLMAGSLIKNPGGGIAPTGGYIAVRHDLIELCSYRLTTPGTGKEIGCTLGHNRELFMGAFNAPHVTGEALKTAIFASAFFELFGYGVTPKYDEPRADIIESIMLGGEKELVAFCQGIQQGAPVDSFVVPEPWDMPGYDSQVIMAAGAFTLGASIELSADAPLREPYAAWMQGALNYHSGKLGVLLAAQKMLEKGVLKQ